MGKLNTSPNVADADGVYQTLIDAHAGLSDSDSMALNARLILLLVNHIGDQGRDRRSDQGGEGREKMSWSG